MSILSHIVYRHARPSGIGCTVTLNKNAPSEASWVHPSYGLVVRTSERRGGAIGWDDLAYHLGEAIKVSSRLRDDLRGMINAGDWAHAVRLADLMVRMDPEHDRGEVPRFEWVSLGCWELESVKGVTLFAADVIDGTGEIVVPALAKTGQNVEATLHAIEAHFAAQAAATPSPETTP
jgi:hypothetical protein